MKREGEREEEKKIVARDEKLLPFAILRRFTLKLRTRGGESGARGSGRTNERRADNNSKRYAGDATDRKTQFLLSGAYVNCRRPSGRRIGLT